MVRDMLTASGLTWHGKGSVIIDHITTNINCINRSNNNDNHNNSIILHRIVTVVDTLPALPAPDPGRWAHNMRFLSIENPNYYYYYY